MTRRRDGSPQLSPVAAGVDSEGRVVVATYPQRAMAGNARMLRQGTSLLRVTVER